MKKNYIYTVLFSLVLSAFTVSCSEPDDEVTTGIFDRLFSPTNVEAVIQKKTNVKFKWTAVTNATSYTIELYENQDMTFEGTPKTYEGITDNTYTVEGLLGETQYTARIRALSEEINESKWSAVSFMTEAENIFNSVKDENIEAHAVTLTWDAIDATATKIVLSADGKADITYTLKSTDIANKKAYIDGLEESTSYTAKLYNVDKLRGRADAMVKTPKYVYVFEFKLNGTAEEAMKQIDEKGYLIPYQKDHREIIKIGVEFSAETRNINRWLVETR